MIKIFTTTETQERNAAKRTGNELSLFWRSGNFSDWTTYANIDAAGVKDLLDRYRASNRLHGENHEMLCIDREAMFAPDPRGAGFAIDTPEADRVTSALIDAIKREIRVPIHVYSGRFFGAASSVRSTQDFIEPNTVQRFDILAAMQSQLQWISKIGSVEISLPLGDHENEELHFAAFGRQIERAKFIAPGAKRFVWVQGTRKHHGEWEVIPRPKCDEIIRRVSPYVSGIVVFAPTRAAMDEPMAAAVRAAL